MFRHLPLIALVFLVGCAQTKIITITTKPPDAAIRLDGAEVGKGNVTQPIVFNNKDETHTVTVARLGYKDQAIPLTRSYDQSTLDVELRPLTRRITFTVTPVPAVVSVDGRPLSLEPTEPATAE